MQAAYRHQLYDHKTTTLIISDDADNQSCLYTALSEQGHHVLSAHDDAQARQVLQTEYKNIDAVLLDWMRPKIDAELLIHSMQESQRLRNIPIILLIEEETPEIIQQGVAAGILYYLLKPLEDSAIFSVVNAAIRENQHHKDLLEETTKHRAGFSLIKNCDFYFRTLEEAEQLASFIANFFRQPDKVVLGLAELLINAVEHGNLGIEYETKTGLIEQGTWRDEVANRLMLPENATKQVHVWFSRTDEADVIRITDQGKGFDWRNFMTVNPARAMDNHGRGIAMANAVAFSKLEYNDVGNAVTAYANYDDATLTW